MLDKIQLMKSPVLEGISRGISYDISSGYYRYINEKSSRPDFIERTVSYFMNVELLDFVTCSYQLLAALLV